MQPQITRRFFVKGVGLLSASAALAACANDANKEPAADVSAQDSTNGDGTAPLLAIIHTNDSHGHDYSDPSVDLTPRNLSMAAVPVIKEKLEERGYEVLIFDAGDVAQGTPLVDVSLGETAFTFMNYCGYDLMCVGNHEFDRGDEEIKKYEEIAEFPIIAANIVVKETGELRFTPQKMFELMDGTKVGVFGLATPTTTTTSRPENTEPFTFISGEDLFKCAQEQVDDLRKQGAEIVVCLGHLGNSESAGLNTSKNVLANVTGIDVFIDGHDHQVVEEEVEGTLLVETGSYMKNIGVVMVDSGVPVSELIAAGNFDDVDPSAQAVIKDVQDQVDEQLNVVLASTPFTLHNDTPDMRNEETNLGDLYTDAIAYDAEQATGSPVDGAIVNSGAMRSMVEEGDISLETVKTVAPFADYICVVRISGAQLLEAIEAACQAVSKEAGISAFPQVSGIEYTVNATVPYEKGEEYPDSTFVSPAAPGSRVTIHTVGGADFDENETYSIATIDFVAQGGDTYYQFKVASEKEQPVVCDFDYEALVGYLIGPLDHKVDERYREPQGRITIITD